MGAIGGFLDSITNTGNTVSGVMSDYTRKQAEFDLNIMKNQLQEDVNGKMRLLQQSDNWEDWEQELNEFFAAKQSAMEDPNSIYYCRNNYTANLAQQMIEGARVNYQNQAANMAMNKLQQQDAVKLNNSLEILFKNYSGQELQNRGKTLIDSASSTGLLDPQQYENYSLMIYDKSIENEVNNRIDSILPEAVRAGKTWEQVKKDMLSDISVQRYDRNGFMVETDATTAMNKAIKANKDKYDAAVYEYQTGNQKWFSDDTNSIYTEIGKLWAGDTNVNVNNLLQRCRRGLERNQNMQEKALPSGAKDKNTDEYNSYIKLLNGIMKESTTGSSGLEKNKWTETDAKNLAQFTIDSLKRGDQSTLGGFASGYTAFDYFVSEVEKEYNQAYGTNMSFVQIEQKVPVVGQFFTLLEKDLPPEYQGIINSCKSFCEQLFPDDKKQSSEEKKAYMEYWPEIFNLIKDTLYEQDVSSLDAVQQKALVERFQTNLNSMYGGVLQKKREFKYMKDSVYPDTLRNYKEGFNQEKTMAKAMQERDSNVDLIYSDKYGNYKLAGDKTIQDGLTRLEADERRLLEGIVGHDIDEKDLHTAYQSDGVDDVTAQKIYTYNGYDYRFHSEDGKKIIAERKETGSKDWETIKTSSQQAKYDKPENQARRVVNTYDIKEMPPYDYYITRGGYKMKLTQSMWENDNTINKRKIIEEFIKNDPEAAQRWIDSLQEREWIDDPIAGKIRKK